MQTVGKIRSMVVILHAETDTSSALDRKSVSDISNPSVEIQSEPVER